MMKTKFNDYLLAQMSRREISDEKFAAYERSINDLKENNKGIISIPTKFVAFFQIVNNVVEERRFKNFRKKLFLKTFNLDESKVASSIEELNENTSVLLDDITFSAAVNGELLRNISMIVGNADFSALKDMEVLNRLNVVLGNVTLSNLNGFNQLSIYGNLDLTLLEDFTGIEKIHYVKGIIKIDQDYYTFEEFKNKFYPEKFSL